MNVIIANNSRKSDELGYSSKEMYKEDNDEYLVIDFENKCLMCAEHFDDDYKNEKKEIDRLINIIGQNREGYS